MHAPVDCSPTEFDIFPYIHISLYGGVAFVAHSPGSEMLGGVDEGYFGITWFNSKRLHQVFESCRWRRHGLLRLVNEEALLC